MIHLYESKHRESYAIRLHHHDNFQVLYALEGEGSIDLNGRSDAFSQDHVAIIAPYDDHAVSSDSNLTLVMLEFDAEAVTENAADNWRTSVFERSALLQLSPFAGGELKLLLRKLLFEQSRQDVFSGWAMRIHLSETLLLLARARQSPQVADANGLRAEKIRAFIDTHYYESLTPNDLAVKWGISGRHATQIFKEQYRMTPMQYLTEVRMGIAKKLLAETDKDIVSISFEVGYESLPTFYRVFKNSVKMSPNKYRLTVRHP